jgi:hypothetical protein
MKPSEHSPLAHDEMVFAQLASWLEDVADQHHATIAACQPGVAGPGDDIARQLRSAASAVRDLAVRIGVPPPT